MNDNSITYKIGWFASVEDGPDSREVVVDAFNGSTLVSESWVVSANYSREGTVSGYVRKRNNNHPLRKKDFENLRVKAVNLSGQSMDSDYTDSDGEYSLRWTGATGTYFVGAELESEYVRSTSDEENDDLDYWKRFTSPYTATQDWTFSNDSKYNEQINMFYHTNEIARWFDDNFYDVRFKVDLIANTRIGRDAPAQLRGGSSPDMVFSDRHDAEEQADVVYHEYVHAIMYKLDNAHVGTSGQGLAMGEAVAFYFGSAFLNDYLYKPGPNSFISLTNYKKFPRDYNNTSSEHYRGLIPAGAAWDLREDIGGIKADKIIFAAMEMDSPRSNTFQRFYDNVLLADDDLYGNGRWTWKRCSQGGDKSPHAGEIWHAFSYNHGMPSFKLKEDPDCPSSKLPAPPAAIEAVEGAYPNPFNSSVNLRYHLNERGRVEVAVYSVTGQLIRRLLSQDDVQRGAYSVAWDGLSDGGTQVASGMYLVRVESPSLVKSFKLSLIR